MRRSTGLQENWTHPLGEPEERDFQAATHFITKDDTYASFLSSPHLGSMMFALLMSSDADPADLSEIERVRRGQTFRAHRVRGKAHGVISVSSFSAGKNLVSPVPQGVLTLPRLG